MMCTHIMTCAYIRCVFNNVHLYRDCFLNITVDSLSFPSHPDLFSKTDAIFTTALSWGSKDSMRHVTPPNCEAWRAPIAAFRTG